MPLYEYECDACGERYELIRKFSDPPLETCPKCGKGPVRKLVSSPAFQFKGSGWYITDCARKGESEKSSAGKATRSDDKAGKSDSSATDSSSKSGSTSSDTSSSEKPAATAANPGKSEKS